jgi:N-acetylneuraminate synthase
MEFSAEQWAGLASHARDRGLIFLSTPFSLAAVDLLERLDMAAWKIGSGDINTLPLIDRVSQTGTPVLLSSGMSTWSELDAATSRVRARGAPLAIFQCTTSYPCPPQALGLNIIGELQQRYRCPVGLSDHSGNIYASCAAATLGANLIEVHLAFTRDCFGPDVTSSVTVEELAKLVEGVKFINTALAHPVAKDEAALARQDLRKLFGRSLVAARDLPEGHELTAADIAMKKPAHGIAANRLPELLGRRLRRAYRADEMFEEKELG